MIRVAREMREHYVSRLSVEIFAQETRHLVIRCMTMPAQYTLFERPRIKRAGAQHLDLVIRFDNQKIRRTKPLSRQAIDITQIDCDSHFHALRLYRESHGIDCVVWDHERPEAERPDLEFLRRPDRLSAAQIPALIPQTAGIERSRGDVDRDAKRFRERRKASSVIRMLVRDDDGV